MSDLAPAGSGSRSEELGEAVPGRPTSAIGGDARSPVGAAARTGRWRRRHPRSPEVILVVAFAVSRIVAASVGVRFDASVLDGTVNTDMWQLLDVRLLKDQLIQSVWHLNSQPPLFNLYGGWLLKLPSGWQQPVETFAALCLGLVIVLCTYRLMVELGVHDIVALVVTLVGVVASPSYLLYENWLNYAYPTAACGVFGAWCLIRYLRTHRARFGLGFFSAYAVMVLVNSTYQIEWLVLAGVVVLVALRHRWRQVVAVAAVPLVVVLTWYVKDAALFGTTTTSSWLGMNLSRDVLYKAPPSEIARMQQEGTLTPLASVPAFGAPGAYVPKFVRARPSSIAALGALTKADGATNFNNPIYISVSSQYLATTSPSSVPTPRSTPPMSGIRCRSGWSPPTRTSSTRPTGRTCAPTRRSTTAWSSGNRPWTRPPPTSSSGTRPARCRGCPSKPSPSTPWRWWGCPCWPGGGAGTTRHRRRPWRCSGGPPSTPWPPARCSRSVRTSGSGSSWGRYPSCWR